MCLQCCLVVTWLVPHGTAPCHVTSCKATYIGCSMFSGNLPPVPLAERPRSLKHGGGTDKSDESWSWRRKFSNRSCQDSNTLFFDYKSGSPNVCILRIPDCSIYNNSGSYYTVDLKEKSWKRNQPVSVRACFLLLLFLNQHPFSHQSMWFTGKGKNTEHLPWSFLKS